MKIFIIDPAAVRLNLKKYTETEINTRVLLFCNIPIVIAYMKKKLSLGIALSIINVLYSNIYYKNIKRNRLKQ